MKYSVIILVLIFCSCSKSDNKMITSDELTGKWIEVEKRMDTLTFELMGDLEVMDLDRGKELTNGFLLPKSGSGNYSYILLEEEISLNWMLSSNSAYNNYYFKVTDDQLVIGNFYDSNLGDTLTFEKLE